MRVLRSLGLPNTGTSFIDTLHLGHGNALRFLILASKILEPDIRYSHINHGDENTLFWVVSGISEDAWIEAMLNPIGTGYDNAMAVGLNEFGIQQMLPLPMKKLSLTMSQEGRI